MLGPKVVAFIGPIGAGKSTAAKAFKPGVYARIGFADPLKNMLFALGLTGAELYGADKESPSAMLGGRTPRYAMQKLGQEWGRDLIHNNLWVNAWSRAVDVSSKPTHIVVDDLRYKNEYHAVRSFDGIIVRVMRDVPYDATHPSEQFWPDFQYDYMLNNSGSEPQFIREVVKLAIKLCN